MRIAVAANGPDLDSQVEPVLGRADWFVLVDGPDGEFEAVENPFRDMREGCGKKVAALLASHGVRAVIAGNYGAKAALACRSRGLSVVCPYTGTVRQAAQRHFQLLAEESASDG